MQTTLLQLVGATQKVLSYIGKSQKKFFLCGQSTKRGREGRVHNFSESSPPQVLRVVYIDKNEFPVKKKKKKSDRLENSQS